MSERKALLSDQVSRAQFTATAFGIHRGSSLGPRIAVARGMAGGAEIMYRLSFSFRTWVESRFGAFWARFLKKAISELRCGSTKSTRFLRAKRDITCWRLRHRENQEVGEKQRIVSFSSIAATSTRGRQ